MVVDRYRHVSDGKILYGLFQHVLIVVWINPQFPDIARSVSGVFETHQRNMLDKGEVPIDVVHELGEARDRQFVQYHPDLHADAVASRLMETGNGLIERTLRLHHIVVSTGVVRSEEHTSEL